MTRPHLDLTARREWVVSVGIPVSYLTLGSMNEEFRTLIHRYLTAPLYGLGLSVVESRGSLSTGRLYGPAVAMRNDMLVRHYLTSR